MLEHRELMRILVVTDFSYRSPKDSRPSGYRHRTRRSLCETNHTQGVKHPELPEMVQNKPRASHQTQSPPTWAAMCWAQRLHRALLQSRLWSPSTKTLETFGASSACQLCSAVTTTTFHIQDRTESDLLDATGGADGSFNTLRRVQDDFTEARLGEIEMSSIIWHLKHEEERLFICFHLHLPPPLNCTCSISSSSLSFH